jgi:hypothetical protein
VWAQTPIVFFDGNEVPDGVSYYSWGFTTNPMGVVPNKGYTPGTSAIWWETSDWNWQGIGLSLINAPVDLSADWDLNFVEYKIIAPAGINTMAITVYDWNDDRIKYILEEYDSLYNGEWLHIKVPLTDFEIDTAYGSFSFDSTQVYAVEIEAAYENMTIPDEMYIDDVWIGNPMIAKHITLFNGNALGNGIGWEKWGFGNGGNDALIIEGEGYTPGTNAVWWEYSDWDWQGIGLYFNPQNLEYAWPDDTLKIKVKAPAGINNLNLGWYDWSDNYAYYVLDANVLGFNDEWKILEIALSDFTVPGGFDKSTVYYFSIEADAYYIPVPEKVLFDDIWTGTPTIDVIPPEPPANVSAYSDPAFPYTNLVMWDDVTSESGESYNVYASMDPITDLNADGVLAIASNVEEETLIIPHRIYYPLTDGSLSYYYAVECVDAAGNTSVTFTTMVQPFTNTGKGIAVISLDAPQNFQADGDLSEWSHIQPMHFKPSENIYSGNFTDDDDLTVNCYVAMDNQYMYVAFDVIDDAYTWSPTNTVDWWDDEAIEYFIGLYEMQAPHQFFESGANPDYRLLFIPDTLRGMNEAPIYGNGDANYYFEGLGQSDYVVESRIAFSDFQGSSDSVFIPERGMLVPFEIFVADSDIPDGGNEGRLQWGDNPLLDPWGSGPKAWSSTWIGLPDFVLGVEEVEQAPLAYSLSQNYPNPFNPTTNIKYSLAEDALVQLNVYNVLGQKVTSIVNQTQSAGFYEVQFNGSGLSSGVYIVTLNAGSQKFTKKMVLMK